MVSGHKAYSILTALTLIFFAFGFTEAQNSIPADNNSSADQKSLTEKKEELSRIKKEISSLELELKTKTMKEKKTNTVLENYSKQSFLLNRLVNKLKKEEKIKQKQITDLQLGINSLEKEIESVQNNYSKYIVTIYKSGKNSEWSEIFNSSSVQQGLLRYKYLNEFSERRRENLNELKDKKEKLKEEKITLDKELREKELFTKQKLDEKDILTKKLKERKKILNVIKHDKKALANELKLKKKSEAKIRDIINSLIEQADRKKEQYAELSPNPDIPGSELQISEEKKMYYPDFSSFTNLKGRMNWPVSKGKIVNNFGENRNKVLNTITINYGIDIQPSSDNNVKAVARGIVSAVEWIPGYGSVIIMTHNEDFRTVYGHLSEIFVEEGDRIRESQVIATVGEDLDGRILHFEIWNSRVNQDPEIWLAGNE
ncbi:MAG: murein hydrolase activator EnvC family protein [Ignavibacteria bacterium]